MTTSLRDEKLVVNQEGHFSPYRNRIGDHVSRGAQEDFAGAAWMKQNEKKRYPPEKQLDLLGGTMEIMFNPSSKPGESS